MSLTERLELFIDGEFRAGTGEIVEVVNPATNQTFGRAATASESDIDAAVSAARRALPAWSAMSVEERAGILGRFAQALAARGQDTAALCSQENGMPIVISGPANGQAPAGIAAMYAEVARSLVEEQARPSRTGSTLVRRVPVGVVAALSPWNYPQTLAMMKIAPALAAGCTVVFKAAIETPLDAYVFADAAVEAGVPAGVLNVVPADVAAAQHLVAHEGVDKVAFTGSTAVGRTIGETCGRLLRPVTLELGGKSAGIVCADVDLQTLGSQLFGACFPNNGMTCYATTRLLVPHSRYDEIAQLVTHVAESLTVGDPLETSTLIGPMVNKAHQQRVLDRIADGKASGATLLTGGSAPDREGSFVTPTVFGDVDNSSHLAREEIFGPVLSLIRYRDEEEALALANDSDYGLAGTVWSSDEGHARSVARRMRTGTVGINSYSLDLGSPFGGVKASGYGRELGPEGLDAYLTYQSIYTTTSVS